MSDLTDDQTMALAELRHTITNITANQHLVDEATQARSRAVLAASETGLTMSAIQREVPEIGSLATVSRDLKIAREGWVSWRRQDEPSAT